MIITAAYYTMCKYFIDFRPPIRFICERSDENETYNSVTVSVSVRFRCICETALMRLYKILLRTCKCQNFKNEQMFLNNL